MPAPAFWDEGRVERLKTLYAEGMSCAQIANALGFVSRNAVIGKVHRLGLERRGKGHTVTIKRAKPTRAAARSMANSFFMSQFGAQPKIKPEKVLRLPRFVEAEPSRNLTFADLEFGQCHYPTSPEGEELRFCGHPVFPNRSYCPAHARLVIAPAPRRTGHPQEGKKCLNRPLTEPSFPRQTEPEKAI